MSPSVPSFEATMPLLGASAPAYVRGAYDTPGLRAMLHDDRRDLEGPSVPSKDFLDGNFDRRYVDSDLNGPGLTDESFLDSDVADHPPPSAAPSDLFSDEEEGEAVPSSKGVPSKALYLKIAVIGWLFLTAVFL
jgi:hypothetical protein